MFGMQRTGLCGWLEVEREGKGEGEEGKPDSQFLRADQSSVSL